MASLVGAKGPTGEAAISSVPARGFPARVKYRLGRGPDSLSIGDLKRLFEEAKAVEIVEV